MRLYFVNKNKFRVKYYRHIYYHLCSVVPGTGSQGSYLRNLKSKSGRMSVLQKFKLEVLLFEELSGIIERKADH